MNNNMKYLLINAMAKLNGKGTVIAYRLNHYNLSSFMVSFYLIKETEEGYEYYKVANKHYGDNYAESVIKILEEKGYKDISYYEKTKNTIRKTFLNH